MTTLVHPRDALFKGEKPFPVVASCDHYAGSEKLILKALELQQKLGPIFDVSCDCEDGAKAGEEKTHAEMVVRVVNGAENKFGQVGVRIHDYTHPHWKADLDILVSGAGEKLAHICLPKPTSARQVAEMIEYVQGVAAKHGIKRQIPMHALVETHGALREAYDICALPWMQVLDFGLLDFVSGHHGAIPASAMRSPGQFEHHLLIRAKTEIVAAALANGVVPAHNVSVDLKNVEGTFQDARRAVRSAVRRLLDPVDELPIEDDLLRIRGARSVREERSLRQAVGRREHRGVRRYGARRDVARRRVDACVFGGDVSVRWSVDGRAVGRHVRPAAAARERRACRGGAPSAREGDDDDGARASHPAILSRTTASDVYLLLSADRTAERRS